MRTSVTHGSYRARLVIGGEPAQIYGLSSYDDDDADGMEIVAEPSGSGSGSGSNKGVKRTTCYVESRPGESYIIEVQAIKEEEEARGIMSVECFVDGDQMGALRVPPGKTRQKDGRYLGPTVGVAPFTFSAVLTTDNDALASPSGGSEMGEVRLGLHRVELVGHVEPRGGGGRKGKRGSNEEGSGYIHELAKKRVSERTVLGPPVIRDHLGGGGRGGKGKGKKKSHHHAAGPTHNHQQPKYYYLDPRDKPYGEIVFRYRSRALLELQGLVKEEEEPSATSRSATRSPSQEGPSHYYGRNLASSPNKKEIKPLVAALGLQGKTEGKAKWDGEVIVLSDDSDSEEEEEDGAREDRHMQKMEEEDLEEEEDDDEPTPDESEAGSGAGAGSKQLKAELNGLLDEEEEEEKVQVEALLGAKQGTSKEDAIMID